jgi:hypothetical protein
MAAPSANLRSDPAIALTPDADRDAGGASECRSRRGDRHLRRFGGGFGARIGCAGGRARAPSLPPCDRAQMSIGKAREALQGRGVASKRPGQGRAEHQLLPHVDT